MAKKPPKDIYGGYPDNTTPNSPHYFDSEAAIGVLATMQNPYVKPRTHGTKNAYPKDIATQVTYQLDLESHVKKDTGRSRDLKFLHAQSAYDAYAPRTFTAQYAAKKKHSSLSSLLDHFERDISEFTDAELRARPLYANRRLELVSIAARHIAPGETPAISRGLADLMQTSIAYLRQLAPSRLKEYQELGLDIHDSLIGMLPLQTVSGECVLTDGVTLASDFLHSVRQEPMTHPAEHWAEHRRYAAENAVRTVRAFMAIAEHERFKSDKTKQKDPIKMAHMQGHLERSYESREQEKDRTLCMPLFIT